MLFQGIPRKEEKLARAYENRRQRFTPNLRKLQLEIFVGSGGRRSRCPRCRLGCSLYGLIAAVWSTCYILCLSRSSRIEAERNKPVAEMPNLLMIDNWSLEEVCSLLLGGVSTHSIEEIAFDPRRQKHLFRQTPESIIQFDALLQLLSDLVLRDELVVDDRYATGWCFPSSPMLPLQSESVVKLYPFLSSAAQLAEPRKVMLDELCITQSLKDLQDQNDVLWKEKREYGPCSAVIWGGASMLARSHVLQMPYTGHPLRQRLIKQTALVAPRASATDKVMDVINTERTRLFQQIGASGVRTYANFNLPPVAVEVINNSQTADELIPVALQLRDKYSKVRKWLTTYEQAYADEDTKQLIKHKKKLDSVAKSIDALQVPKSGGTTNLSIGVSWLRLSWSGNPLEAVQNKFGVRAAISELILASQGQTAFKKLLSFFDEENSKLGLEVYKTFAERSTSE
jgi:hypothetical protein